MLLISFLSPAKAINLINNPSDFINPFIGTGGHGHTFPGATVPFGMVQLSPDTRIDGSWDGCGGYHYDDKVIYGFSHTHLSGTGCSDYGDIAFLPYLKSDFEKLGAKAKPTLPLNHKEESASAAYYKIGFNDLACTVELTASARCGLQQYTFDKEEDIVILLLLDHRDVQLEASINEESKTHISGMRRSKAWAEDEHIYFDTKFSVPFEKAEYRKNGTGTTLGIFHFHVTKGQRILISTGISNVDEKGSLQNREAEIPEYKDFNTIHTAGKADWNKELIKIQIEPNKIKGGNSDNIDQVITFYTALYHACVHPSLASDYDGRYRGRDNKIHNTESKFDYYSVFSLWDTYRGLHPLLSIIDQKRTNDFINTFLCQYQQGGLLPVWELASNETNCMIGYHCVPVIWDAVNKGIHDFDMKLALEAMLASANQNQKGLEEYRKDGFVHSETEHESVSKTLEYSYDDWCIARMAEKMGDKETAKKMYLRSLGWKNLHDTLTGFVRARRNGGFIEPFVPAQVDQNYTEANAWQYCFAQARFLSNSYGTNNQKLLQELFLANSALEGRQQADITGLIGQYAQGNEPSHHMIYLLENDRLRNKYLSQIMNNFYQNKPDGLIGNEDCGQMSAWFVLSAMGFYPAIPGDNMDVAYRIGVPLFKHVTIHFENNRSIDLSNEVADKEGAYDIEGATYPGYLSHITLMSARELHWIKKPFANSALQFNSYSNNLFRECIEQYCVAPAIRADRISFSGNLKVRVTPYPSMKHDLLYVSNEGTLIAKNGSDTAVNLIVDHTTDLTAYTQSESMTYEQGYAGDQKHALPLTVSSTKIKAHYVALPAGRSIKNLSQYDNQYTAGGPDGMIDLLRGQKDWRIGGWQGYHGKDFMAIVDLGSVQKVKRLGLGCIQESKPWIMMPKEIIFEVSTDGVNYHALKTITPVEDAKAEEAIIKDLYTDCGEEVRFIRVKAVRYGALPSWHISAGEESWLFVDEILIEQ
jgi:predicted alpha-1,2-mannosidase